MTNGEGTASFVRAIAAALIFGSGTVAIGQSAKPPSTSSATTQVGPTLKVGVARWTVGVESGPPQQEFGKLIAAALDKERTVYLLDGSNQTIRVFDSTGRFLQVVGRSGKGPGEFSQPRAMNHDGDTTLFVLDAVTGVSMFSTARDTTRFLRTINLGMTATGMCLAGRAMFVFGFNEGKVIHEYTLSGKLVRSFGDLFGPAGHDVQRVISSAGKIACIPGSRVIVAGSLLLPTLVGYSMDDGSRKWVDSIPGFAGTRVMVQGRAYTMVSPPGGYDRQAVIGQVGPGVVLVQAEKASRNPIPETIRSCLLIVQTGRCGAVTTTWPLLHAVANGIGVAVSSDPFPTARLLSVTMNSGQRGQD